MKTKDRLVRKLGDLSVELIGSKKDDSIPYLGIYREKTGLDGSLDGSSLFSFFKFGLERITGKKVVLK